MILTSELQDGVLLIKLPQGSLDAATAREFREAADQILGEHRKVVLDFSQVAFVDSAGLGVVLAFLRRVTQDQGDLKVCGLNKGVRALFQLVRMHRIVEIFETAQEASTAFANP